MKKTFVLLLAAVLCLGACAHGEPARTLDETWDLVRQAYIFSFPLVLMDATLTVGTNTETPANGKAPINQAGHAKTLATAKFRQVVTPNVDTLYTQIFYDLSQDALVIRKPAVDRYLTFQVMDAWSDTVAMFGTGADTQDAKTYLLTGPGFDGEVPEGTVNPFEDVPANEWYTDAVLWAVAEGVAKGMDATHFDPIGDCTRAQIVTFLFRAQ